MSFRINHEISDSIPRYKGLAWNDVSIRVPPHRETAGASSSRTIENIYYSSRWKRPLSFSFSLLSDALVLINGSILRSPQWFFAVLFAPHRVLRKVIRKRGTQGKTGGRGGEGHDGTPTAIITWHFVLRPQEIFSSPPFRPRGGPDWSFPLASGRVVSHPTKGKQRDEGVNANEFTILQSRQGKKLRTTTICNLHTNARYPESAGS